MALPRLDHRNDPTHLISIECGIFIVLSWIVQALYGISPTAFSPLSVTRRKFFYIFSEQMVGGRKRRSVFLAPHTLPPFPDLCTFCSVAYQPLPLPPWRILIFMGDRVLLPSLLLLLLLLLLCFFYSLQS
jgi:hypothetical protein